MSWTFSLLTVFQHAAQKWVGFVHILRGQNHHIPCLIWVDDFWEKRVAVIGALGNQFVIGISFFIDVRKFPKEEGWSNHLPWCNKISACKQVVVGYVDKPLAGIVVVQRNSMAAVLAALVSF
jgi:hypothetical protein